MCDHHHGPASARPRRGYRLEDGAAHGHDHATWTRRGFLTALGAAAAGSAFYLAGRPVRAFGQAPLLDRLRRLETDRVLVLLQLSGGNDGLNMIVPVENALYYNARPDIAVARRDTLPLSNELGLNSAMSGLEPLWQEGRMAVLQNVGYPQPDLSHFRATDIWMSGSDADVYDTTGWAGRYLETAYPDAVQARPDAPLAVQIGGTGSMLFQGAAADMGMTIASVELFEQILAEGTLYQTDGLPQTPYGDEMAFVRDVANASFNYAGAVRDAAEAGPNEVEYPAGNPLAQNLSIVARLVKGRLGARIYHVTLGGFDTHAGQVAAHTQLLRRIGEALPAFFADLGMAEREQDVLVATFSEFGRRLRQNTSNGTDHGTAAPLLLFGPGVAGGLHGDAPDLDDLDAAGNLRFDLDFRRVYATLMADWFGLPRDEVAEVLGGPFDPLSVIADPASVGTEPGVLPPAFALEGNYPNPFNPQTTIAYRLDAGAPVRLQVFDVQGRLVQTLVDAPHGPGRYEVAFDGQGLASGTYLYRLVTPQGVASRSMVLLR